MRTDRKLLGLLAGCFIVWGATAALAAGTNDTIASPGKDADMKAMLDFYTSQSAWTDPGKFRSMYEGIPEGITGVVQSVQNVLVHGAWLWAYKMTPTQQQDGGFNIRKIEEILGRISQMKAGSLAIPRSDAERLVVNCRQFAVLTCSILRSKGIPARARAGYALYTWGRGKHENHWVCEYWQPAERRWIRVDAQIDDKQRQVMRLDFNTLDIHGDFVTAGDGWQRYRQGKVPIDYFGLGGKDGWNGMGWSMVMPNVVCDTMALNKDELLPWDVPPHWTKKEAEMTPDDIELIDRLAAAQWNDIRSLYGDHSTLQMPKDFDNRKQE